MKTKKIKKMIRTLKVELHIDPHRRSDVLQMMQQFNKVFDLHTAWAVNKRSCCKQKAHEDLYRQIRNQLPLYCSFVQTARDVALAAVKVQKRKNGGWTNFSIPTRKRDCVSFDCRTFKLRGQQLTLSIIGKRLKVIVSRPPKFFKEIWDTWGCKSGQLLHKKGRFFFCFNFVKEAPKHAESTKVLGIDRGLKNVIATSDGTLVSGKEINRVRRRRLFQRRQLQAKGTRSAKRRLQALSGKEKRFSRQAIHKIVNDLLKKDHDTYVLEDLKNIRKNNKKSRKFNKKLSDWSFAHLQFVLGYKAQALGRTVVYVDPWKTSQRCNHCGFVSPNNRKGVKFLCRRCGRLDHADLNAAKNIRDLHILSSTGEAGCPMNHPHAPRTQVERSCL
jgi:IS605 OrfB family transposase